MRPPWTAKDDQPGPIGRRHSSTGGDAAQSVAIRTPGITPSRRGPRNPGQSGPATVADGFSFGAAGTTLAVVGADLAGAGVAGVTAGVAGSATGSLAPWARSRSSGVCVHRPCKSGLKSLETPPVRTNAHPP